jgi:hypothetical protein
LQGPGIGQVQGWVDVVRIVLASEVEEPLAEAVAVGDTDRVRTFSDNKQQLIIKLFFFNIKQL